MPEEFVDFRAKWLDIKNSFKNHNIAKNFKKPLDNCKTTPYNYDHEVRQNGLGP